MTTSITFTLTPDPRDPFEAPGLTRVQAIDRIRAEVESWKRGATIQVES